MRETRNGAAPYVPNRGRSIPAFAMVFILAMAISSPSVGGALGPESTRGTASDRILLAVLPFEDGTADPAEAHWRYVAPGLLKRQLDDLGALRLASEGAVDYGMAETGLTAGDPIDPNRAREVGERIEAHWVIWGDYGRENEPWRVRVRVINVATGEALGPFVAVEADWFDLRDAVNEQLLSALAIAPTEEERREMSERWTSSAETLAWYGKGYMLQQQGRPTDEMETCFRRALAADPNCAHACAALAGTLANQGKFEPAEDLARRALKLNDKFAFAHALLGFVLGSQRRFEEAEDAFRTACRLDRDEAGHLVHLAQSYRLKGKWDETKAFLQMAVSLDPTNAVAHAALAKAHAATRSEQEARRELREAAYFMPKGVAALNVHLELAETYERLGSISDAVTHYREIVNGATQLGMNPKLIRLMEGRIQRLEGSLSPTFIEATAPKRLAERDLDRILADKLSQIERQLVGNPFSCTPTMEEWARDITRDFQTGIDKARAIFSVLAQRQSARGQAKSRTAREVFAAWDDPTVRLVCMDHAVLFVALARAVDLNAFFVQVTRTPAGTVMNHACAAVFDEDRALLVDPVLRWFGASHQEYAVLDDLQTSAFLCFYNRAGDAHPLLVCRAALKLWPDSTQGRLRLASLLLQLDQAAEARRVLAEVPAPTSEGFVPSTYWMAQGLLAEADGDLERAEQHLRTATSMCSTQAASYFRLGQVCLQRGRLAKARAALRDCLRNDPDAMTAGVARHLIAQINERIGFEMSPDAFTPTSGSP